MSRSNDDKQSASEALQQVRAWKIPESPYFATRIMARAQERGRWLHGKLRLVQSALTVGLVVLAASYFFPGQDKALQFDATVGQATSVRLPLEQWKNKDVSYIRVKLGQNIAFYSENNPLLEKRRQLLLDWERISQKYKVLPIVVQSNHRGSSGMSVELLNENKKPVLNEKLQISFHGKNG